MPGLRESFDRERPDFPPGTPFWIDPSFARLAACHPRLQEVARHLDTRAVDAKGAAGLAAEAPSSYGDHRYEALFRALISVLRPRRCVELGVLHGFSLLTIARTLQESGLGRVDGYDLFEQYPYTNASYASVTERLKRTGLSARAAVHRAEAREVASWTDEVDFLHVDLSNDGEVYRWVFSQWSEKVTQIILLEGGSVARDRVDWMRRYGKSSIAAAIEEIRASRPEWTIAVLDPYPSITVAFRQVGLAAT